MAANAAAAAAAATFQPVAERVQEVLAMVNAARMATTTEAQSRLYAQFDMLSSNPEFVFYLTYIFAYMGSQVEPATRQMSGLILKRSEC